MSQGNLRPIFALNNPIRLSGCLVGGPVVMLQADEGCFSHKPKHHCDRCPQKTQSVFGIVDTSTSPATGYKEMIDTKDSETLLPIVNSGGARTRSSYR